jgi:hypothetical protein
MIVNYNSDDIRQETAALSADTIEGQHRDGRYNAAAGETVDGASIASWFNPEQARGLAERLRFRRKRLCPQVRMGARGDHEKKVDGKLCYSPVLRGEGAELEGNCPTGLAARTEAAPRALGRGLGNGVLGEVDRTSSYVSIEPRIRASKAKMLGRRTRGSNGCRSVGGGETLEEVIPLSYPPFQQHIWIGGPQQEAPRKPADARRDAMNRRALVTGGAGRDG